MPPLIDITILVAGLLVIAVVMVTLARRARRTARNIAFVQVSGPVTPTVMPTTEPIAAPVVKPEPKRRRPRRVKPKATKPPTPIDRVVGLLKDPDSLATAFLLREILDPPKSRRG